MKLKISHDLICVSLCLEKLANNYGVKINYSKIANLADRVFQKILNWAKALKGISDFLKSSRDFMA